MRYQDSKGQEMQPFQGVRQTLIVASEAAEACHPAETPFYYPATGQEHKASLGVGQLDDFQANALFRGIWAASSPV